MKILQVIHGYPMRYNAGSEVYTQNLAQGLADRHEVHVFTREENNFRPDYDLSTEVDTADHRVTLHVINTARSRDRYRQQEIDHRFRDLLNQIKPDIVHFGHLSHLSTSMVLEARAYGAPVIFTLHDYWLMCPRGQFIQISPEEPSDLWALCDGQEDRKCAERCYSRYFSGGAEDSEIDIAYWSNWVGRRMAHVREVSQAVDLFIAPSRYLLERFRDEFGVPEGKIVYLDYGFHLERLHRRVRQPGEPFTFGYIGTHIPAKGIHHLIEAFGNLRGHGALRIWGRHRGVDTEGLKAIALNLPQEKADQIEWMDEYRNPDIVTEVFDRCDAIVVPSIWAENSPLVIHEALQARVPVITANFGGMAEYVHHEHNGLLFNHRDPDSLATQMQSFIDDPQHARQLGSRGYLRSPDGNVPSLRQHVQQIEKLYDQVLACRKANL